MPSLKIVIVTDAWEPQVNGVVSTLKATRQRLQDSGHEVRILSPQGLPTFACPTYPEIRLACRPYSRVAQILDDLAPDCIHIATEGPMGLAARRYCINHGLHFTTSFHTRFPEYLRARTFLPLGVTYRWLRWFHSKSTRVMVPTPGIRQALEKRGFRNVVLWSRGVDIDSFKPGQSDHAGIERPLFLYVGRVAVEKNVDAFLKASLPGTKWVIGDGPLREECEQRYPQVRFLGAKDHRQLAAYYNHADVLVFPSRTDTFGLVMVEAMACGVPVAAYPVEGPVDIVEQGKSGVLDRNLERACTAALELPREQVREAALKFSWSAATRQFEQNLTPAGTAKKKNESMQPAMKTADPAKPASSVTS